MPQFKSIKVRIPSLEVKSPSYRYLSINQFISGKGYTKRKAIPKDFDNLQRLLIDLSRDTEISDTDSFTVESIKKAVLLDNIPSCRALLRGLIMSGESDTVISSIIQEDSDVVYVYSQLFFDISVFFNKLLKVAYIRSLPADTEEDTFEKQVLSWGYYLGAKYLAWKIGAKESASMLPSQAVKKVLDDSIWRSSEHSLSAITSQKAKESKSWIPQVLKSAELLNTLETTAGMETALSELKIKLSRVEQNSNTPPEEMDIKG